MGIKFDCTCGSLDEDIVIVHFSHPVTTDRLAPVIFATALVIGMLLFASAAVGQEIPPPPSASEEWAKTANQVQSVIETGNASRWTLERLRNRLAKQRLEAFEITQSGNIRVKALEAQLNALGPPPADGVEEPVDVAERRAAIIAELSDASAPIRSASESFERANVLIEELDSLLREQRAADLLSRYPSPLQIDRWPTALGAIADWLNYTLYNLRSSFDEPARQKQINQTLPLITFLCVSAFVLLIVVQPFALNRLDRFRIDGEQSRRQDFLTLSASLARLIIPGIAGLSLVFAWQIADLNPNGPPAIDDVPMAMAIDLILAVWLGYMIFSPGFSSQRLLELDDSGARDGHRITIFIGIVSALDVLVASIDRYATLAQDAISVLTTALMIVAGFLFWRLARLLSSSSHGSTSRSESRSTIDETAADGTISSGFRRYLCYGLFVAGIAIVLSALAGYIRLSREVFDSTVETIAILGIALVLYHALVYALSGPLGQRQQASEDQKSLLPIVILILLTLIVTPLLALIWGATQTDISDLWRVVNEGLQIGDMRLSIDSFLTVVIVFVIGLVLTRWLQRALKSSVLPRTRMDIGARNAVVTGVGYVGIILATIIALSSAGVNLSSLAIVAGALSVGIGFGMQTIVSNFVSGIILLIERPIKLGDWIEVSGYSGYVRKISVRSTRIETFDRHDVIIPNAELIAGTVTNMTLTNPVGRVIVPVGIAYGSDVEKAKAIMLSAASDHIEVLKSPEPAVLFIALGDSALQFELRCFLRDVDKLLRVKSDLLTEIYTNLRNQGIEIPFPQRDIHVRSQPVSGAPILQE